MGSSLINKFKVFGKIAEMKRIYSVVESSLGKSSCFSVTSGLYGEGKTTLSVGLAMAAADKNNNRVLVVDYNWHSPALHKYFGVDMGKKTDDFFEGDSIENHVQPTGINNLDILPAARENGHSKATMAPELLNQMRKAYDVVVIDTASTFPTNYKMLDPVVIAREADGVVLVALTNVTPRHQLKKACVAIDTAGANIVGVVANQWQNPM